MPVSEDTYNPVRRQYHSTHILAKISDYTTKSGADYVLGVMDVDLYMPSLNFVFGEAYSPGETFNIVKTGIYGADLLKLGDLHGRFFQLQKLQTPI